MSIADTPRGEALSVLHTMRHVLAIITAAVLTINAAHARLPRLSLDDDTVRSFIGSFAHVKRKSEDLAPEYAGEQRLGAATAPLAALLELKGEVELDRVVQAHGFADFAAWTDVHASVASAYAFATGDENLRVRLAEALCLIEVDQKLSADQRATMIEHARGALRSLERARPPQANIDAVRPHLERLASLFGERTPPSPMIA